MALLSECASRLGIGAVTNLSALVSLQSGSAHVYDGVACFDV